ncbi:hypothetical protein KR059_001938 [Drosophila kikkawai]|nr:hypothetical protein KR059_001938 [Drosophila kikkawai]
MQNFTTFFLWALFTCILRQGSFAEDHSGYICLIDDPKQNQCDSICLTELRPRLREVVKAQNEGNGNTRNAVNEIKSKLDTLEAKMEGQLQEVENKLEGRLQGLERQLQEVQTKLGESLLAVQGKIENQLQAVLNQLQLQQAKLEGQLQGVEAKLEGQLQEVQTKLEAKLDESLLAVQTKLGIPLQALANQLQAVSNNKIDAGEGSQLQAKSNKTAAPQKTAKVEVPASSTITIPSGFELIGTRYFRIVYEDVDWYTAERMCRKMGGYLASFRNEEEMKAVIPKLDNWPAHWLGINDEENEGHFVTVASHKPAPFLKWHKEQPNDKDHEENCVNLFNAEMWDSNCNDSLFFICQADNEI